MSKEPITIELEFKYVDEWGRPIFKWKDKEVYFSDIELTPLGIKKTKDIIEYYRKNPNRLTIHGSNPEDDPLGTTVAKHVTIKINK